PLTPSITADVRVEQGVGAKKAVLSLEKGGGYTFVAPRSVSKAELKPYLDEYAAARDAMIAQLKQGAPADDEQFDRAIAALDALESAVKETYVGPFKSNVDPQYVAFRDASEFVADQVQQVGLLGVRKSLPAPFQGETVQELVVYMKQQGLTFAESDAGGENSYKIMFDQMKKLLQQLNPPSLKPRFADALPTGEGAAERQRKFSDRKKQRTEN
ncbi:MAG: hypothetical protein ACRC1K_04030, partial [Planctomycetia bacterium]